MFHYLGRSSLVALLALLFVAGLGRLAQAADNVTQAEYEKLKKEVDDLKSKLSATTPVGTRAGAVDQALENKYGPNAKVVTRAGKLTIGGLIQVWYYTIQNDRTSFIDTSKLPTAFLRGFPFSSNEVSDNDSFRIRRAEIKFTMDIHENVTAVVMIDPAREALSFPSFPSNLGSGVSGDSDVFYDAGWVAGGNIHNNDVRYGTGAAGRMLQDAYIKYHGIIPHHDISVGQMKRRLGEEGTRDSSALDFAERAMITQPADLRDLGLQVHGTWWDERFQYWGGVFDGAGTAFQQRQNRADDNDEKDLVGTILVRPLWKEETWGSLELGYSLLYGKGGEAGGHWPDFYPVDGLNRRSTTHVMQYAWASYMPGGPVRGWWLRGEWGLIRDRFAPEQVDAGPTWVRNPAAFQTQGWSFSTGYKLSDSVFKDDVGSWGSPLEFAFRYETMGNLFTPDQTLSTRRNDIYKTTVYTAGINYYIKGNNAKLQLNYNWVKEESGQGDLLRPTRAVNNDNFVVNFQVAW